VIRRISSPHDRASSLLVSLLIFSPVVPAVAAQFDAETYNKCQEAVRKNAVDDALRLCSGPADEGIPGAQYGLGMLLVNRRSASSSDWVEAKPGKFRVAVLDQTAIVSAVDSGWDFEGKWIESWSIQLLRTGHDSAVASFFRTANNVNIPSTIPWRTFSALAEGSAHKTQ
jgi:hypothetical protein